MCKWDVLVHMSLCGVFLVFLSCTRELFEISVGIWWTCVHVCFGVLEMTSLCSGETECSHDESA